jgi:hypothetical protein
VCLAIARASDHHCDVDGRHKLTHASTEEALEANLREAG